MLELIKPIFNLAYFRQYAISRFWDFLYADDGDKLMLDEAGDGDKITLYEYELVLDGVCLLAKSIGLSTVRSDWIKPFPKNPEKIFTNNFNAALEGPTLNQIENAFGSQLASIFQVGQLICALHNATSWLVPKMESDSLHSVRQIVREEADEILSNIGQLGHVFSILLDRISHIIDPKLYEMLHDITQICLREDDESSN